MAYCSPSALLQSGRLFNGLSPGEARIVRLAILANWLKAVNPAADVTPEAILQRAAPFFSLSADQIRAAKLQLLCEISS